MPATTAKIRLLTKNAAWHTTNAALVLEEGRVIYLSGTNPMRSKVGDGVSSLAALQFADEIVFTSIVLFDSVGGHRWKFTVGPDGMLSQPGEDLGV
jgi:hypothetical protein